MLGVHNLNKSGADGTTIQSGNCQGPRSWDLRRWLADSIALPGRNSMSSTYPECAEGYTPGATGCSINGSIGFKAHKSVRDAASRWLHALALVPRLPYRGASPVCCGALTWRTASAIASCVRSHSRRSRARRRRL